MTAHEFLDYLLGREQTRDLAVQLADVYDQRARSAERVVSGH